MSDRVERACTRCGSFMHHEDDASALREHLKRADDLFRSADLERNKLAAKCNELGVQLDDERRARADAEARLSRAKATTDEIA